MFVVFKGGKRCSSFSFGDINYVDSFKSKREAEIFAFMFSYPLTRDEAEVSAVSMVLGKEYNLGGGDLPSNIKIEYIKDIVYNAQAHYHCGYEKSIKEILSAFNIKYETLEHIEMSAQTYYYNCTGDLDNLPEFIEINRVRTNTKTNDLYVW